jgi:5'(3')-deoxyribonucleotidase
MTAPLVLLDVDGVICDFASRFVEECSRLVGRQLDPKRIDRWEIERWAGLSAEQTRAAYEAAHAPGWCLGLSPYPGAVAFVRELHELAEVVAVTAPMRGPHWHHERVEWLRAIGIPGDHIIFAKRKDLVHGDFLVEDKATTALAWARSRRGQAFLVNRPYNALDEHDPSMVRRVFSFAEILERVRGGER